MYQYFSEHPDAYLVVIPVASFIFCFFLLKWLLKSRLSSIAIDRPNSRSLHAIAVPRTGGLAIMAASLLSWASIGQQWVVPFIVCATCLVALSFLDDIQGLSAGWRFVLHFMVAAGFVIYVLLPGKPAWMGVMLILTIVWMTNLFNFMDGANGFAGGMAIFGFGAYALTAWNADNYYLSLVCLVIATSSGAFLIYNFDPAKIFMGDAGSIPLGFFAAAIGLYGWESGTWPLWFPPLIFSVFIFDATVTLLRRLLRGEKVWQAHRSHYYQRLIQMGWSHRKTVLSGYGLMSLAGYSGIWLINQPVTVIWMALSIWGMVFCLLAAVVDHKWNRYQG